MKDSESEDEASSDARRDSEVTTDREWKSVHTTSSFMHTTRVGGWVGGSCHGTRYSLIANNYMLEALAMG